MTIKKRYDWTKPVRSLLRILRKHNVEVEAIDNGGGKVNVRTEAEKIAEAIAADDARLYVLVKDEEIGDRRAWIWIVLDPPNAEEMICDHSVDIVLDRVLDEYTDRWSEKSVPTVEIEEESLEEIRQRLKSENEPKKIREATAKLTRQGTKSEAGLVRLYWPNSGAFLEDLPIADREDGSVSVIVQNGGDFRLYRLVGLAKDWSGAETEVDLEEIDPIDASFEFFIVYSFGYWGGGETKEIAAKNWRKAGGSLRKQGAKIVERFFSELPFAPRDREANGRESDAWIGGDGSLSWLRCGREEIERIDNTKATARKRRASK